MFANVSIIIAMTSSHSTLQLLTVTAHLCLQTDSSIVPNSQATNLRGLREHTAASLNET